MTAPTGDRFEAIVEEVRAERAIQDAKWGGPSHDDEHDCIDWISFVVKHARCADRSDKDFRQQMLRVAALAIAAIESNDRKSVPQ